MNTFASKREQELEAKALKLLGTLDAFFKAYQLRPSGFVNEAMRQMREATFMDPTTSCELRDMLGDQCSACDKDAA